MAWDSWKVGTFASLHTDDMGYQAQGMLKKINKLARELKVGKEIFTYCICTTQFERYYVIPMEPADLIVTSTISARLAISVVPLHVQTCMINVQWFNTIAIQRTDIIFYLHVVFTCLL